MNTIKATMITAAIATMATVDAARIMPPSFPAACLRKPGGDPDFSASTSLGRARSLYFRQQANGSLVYDGCRASATRTKRTTRNRPVITSDPVAQKPARASRVRVMSEAVPLMTSGTVTPAKTCPMPGPVPGGFGSDIAAHSPTAGASARLANPTKIGFASGRTLIGRIIGRVASDRYVQQACPRRPTCQF